MESLVSGLLECYKGIQLGIRMEFLILTASKHFKIVAFQIDCLFVFICYQLLMLAVVFIILE